VGLPISAGTPITHFLAFSA